MVSLKADLFSFFPSHFTKAVIGNKPAYPVKSNLGFKVLGVDHFNFKILFRSSKLQKNEHQGYWL